MRSEELYAHRRAHYSWKLHLIGAKIDSRAEQKHEIPFKGTRQTIAVRASHGDAIFSACPDQSRRERGEW